MTLNCELWILSSYGVGSQTSQLRDEQRRWNTCTGEVVAPDELPLQSSQRAIVVPIHDDDAGRPRSATAIMRSSCRRQRTNTSQCRAQGEDHDESGDRVLIMTVTSLGVDNSQTRTTRC
jgi:hypothetical protein